MSRYRCRSGRSGRLQSCLSATSKCPEGMLASASLGDDSTTSRAPFLAPSEVERVLYTHPAVLDVALTLALLSAFASIAFVKFALRQDQPDDEEDAA